MNNGTERGCRERGIGGIGITGQRGDAGREGWGDKNNGTERGCRERGIGGIGITGQRGDAGREG